MTAADVEYIRVFRGASGGSSMAAEECAWDQAGSKGYPCPSYVHLGSRRMTSHGKSTGGLKRR